MQKMLRMCSLTAWLSRDPAPRPRRPARPERRTGPTRPALEALEDRTLLSAGQLDPAFNVVGKNTASFNLGGSNNDVAHGAVMQQTDGKAVLVGTAFGDAGDTIGDFAVARFNTDGTPDATFGGTGKVTIPFNLGGAGLDRAFAVVVQQDGKIVVGGSAQISATNYDFAAARRTV